MSGLVRGEVMVVERARASDVRRVGVSKLGVAKVLPPYTEAITTGTSPWR